MENAPHIPLKFDRLTEEEMRETADRMFERFSARRTVRHFSTEPLPMDVVCRCIQAAGTAPSGAHKQPWHFCLVTDADLKKRIRVAAEKEEYENYHGRMNEAWLDDLKPLGTDHMKPHLEDAPALIVVFRQSWTPDAASDSGKSQNYYAQESVGIASGILLSALHECGIATLTHTPSPMCFLAEILDRPAHEKAFLLIPIGYPAAGCQVPDIQRKDWDEMATVHGPEAAHEHPNSVKVFRKQRRFPFDVVTLRPDKQLSNV